MRYLSTLVFLIFACGCSNPPEVRTAEVTRQTVESTVTSVTSGTVRAEKIADLAFGAVGRVRALHVRVGGSVKAGDVLAELENSDLQSVLETARREVARRQSLRATNSLAQSELEQAQRELEVARMAFEKSRIVAPYDGLIAGLTLEVGQLSQITAVQPLPLMTIVDFKPRYIRAEFDEVDLARVAVGMPARVTILALRRAPFAATVRKVVPFISSVREQDRTAEVELTVEAEGNVLPAGASADVEVIADLHKEVFAVPTRAVFGRGKNRSTFVVENGKLRKVPLEIGLFNYDLTEVLSGVPEGSLIAIPKEGLEFVDGMKVKPIS
jgi:HlyD family secretion protein